MQCRIRILCENTVGKATGAIGEHGFSCHIETSSARFLFDTGQGKGLLHNADLLGVELNAVDAVVLSHGHFDHCGGLEMLLKRQGPLDIYAHPDVFVPRYWAGKYERRFNGMPQGRQRLEGLGARFHLSREWNELAPGVWLSGEVPRHRPGETLDPNLVVPTLDGQSYEPDLFSDDQSLTLETDRGLVVVLGCAHAGLVNILDHLCRKTGCDRIYAIIGGTHLGVAGDEQFSEAVCALRRYNVQKIGAAHCTGLMRAAQLYGEFPDRLFFTPVGAMFAA